MKFPVRFITPQIFVEAIGDRDTIEFMDAVSTMEYTEENAVSFMEFLKYTENSDEELELGYWLNKEYVGKVYMTECVKAIIQYAKDELQMKSVNVFVITEHEKSMALLERLDFARKEVLEKDTENKGKEVDRYWYKLIL